MLPKEVKIVTPVNLVFAVIFLQALRAFRPLLICIVKRVFKKEIITPGIRFNTKTNDQKRVLTPKQAYKNGSDWLVIGRPITKGNIRRNMLSLIDHLEV